MTPGLVEKIQALQDVNGSITTIYNTVYSNILSVPNTHFMTHVTQYTQSHPAQGVATIVSLLQHIWKVHIHLACGWSSRTSFHDVCTRRNGASNLEPLLPVAIRSCPCWNTAVCWRCFRFGQDDASTWRWYCWVLLPCRRRGYRFQPAEVNPNYHYYTTRDKIN